VAAGLKARRRRNAWETEWARLSGRAPESVSPGRRIRGVETEGMVRSDRVPSRAETWGVVARNVMQAAAGRVTTWDESKEAFESHRTVQRR
jgi:hypothetical protein